MTTPPPATIKTQDLTKHYGDFAALVDLEVVPGEVYGFLGPNGSGKTTMIRTILDAIRPTAEKSWILRMDSQEQSVEIRRQPAGRGRLDLRR